MKSIGKFNNTIKPSNSIFRSAVIAMIVTAFILLLPFLAMQITVEVDWHLDDFAVAGVLLFGTVFMYQLAARKLKNFLHRIAAGIAILTALLIVWINLAVGIIGSEYNPANLMYIGVLLVGIIGSIIARFQPHGMSVALFTTVFANVLVVIIALFSGMSNQVSRPGEIIILNAFFILLWVASAYMFRIAARKLEAV